MMRRIARDALTRKPDPLEDVAAPGGLAAAREIVAAASEPPGAAALSARLSRALVALLGKELQLAPEHIREVVERELARVRLARRIELHVHPADLALLDSTETMVDRGALLGSLTLHADPALERGGCLLQTDLGEVDARLETRLALALALLKSGAL
jgi:flagellar assembly protein FliH